MELLYEKRVCNSNIYGETCFCFSNRNCTLTLLGARTRRGRFRINKMNIKALVTGYRRFKRREGKVESFSIKRNFQKIHFKYGKLIRTAQHDVQRPDFLLRAWKLSIMFGVNWLRMTGWTFVSFLHGAPGPWTRNHNAEGHNSLSLVSFCSDVEVLGNSWRQWSTVIVP
jgi:hypothetical protein